MRVLGAMTIGLMLAAGGLSACQNPVEAKRERPDPGADAPPQSAQDKAVIAATPQVSMSEEQRREIRDLAKSYLDDAAKELAKGFSPVGGLEDTVVAMQPTETHTWSVSLKRGENYRIIAECDNECEDLDLELVDAAGKIVERDTMPDSYPVINIAPRSDAAYTVRMTMKTCTIAPCYAAARLYHQTGPIPKDDDKDAATTT